MTIESDLKLWKERIARGLAAQKKYASTEDWEIYEDYYLGKQNAGLYVNYLFGLCRAMIPNTYFRNPRVAALPRRQESQAKAPIVEAVDNWLIQEMGLKSQLKLMPYDNFLYGIGILKLGYDSEYGFDTDLLMPPVMTPMGVADLSNETASQKVKNFIKALKGEKRMTEKDLDSIEYNDLVQRGMPWVLRWHPADFIIEPGATCVEDAQWCAFRIFRKLEDIRVDGKYEHMADLKAGWDEEYFDRHQERMVAQTLSREETDAMRTGVQTEPRRDEWVELWELHDKKTQRIQVGARNHDAFLRNERDVLQIDGLPVLAVSFNRNPRSFWGVPDARNLKPLQDELNRITSLQGEYLKSNVRRLITRKSLFNATEKQKFLSDIPIAFIEAEGAEGKTLNDEIFAMQGFVPPELAQRAEQIRADMREIVGFGRNQLGEWNRGEQGGAGRGTATEAQIVQQNSQIRVDERRDILADLLTRAIRKCNQMMFKWWSAPRVIRIAGQMGSNWVQYTGQELNGEYDYSIEPDDALPMSRERRRQESLMLLQAIGPVPELMRNVLMQFEGVNVEAVLQQLQMMQQQQQQAAMMEAAQKGQPGANVPVQVPGMR